MQEVPGSNPGGPTSRFKDLPPANRIATVCVRLETRFSYSGTIGWNNFPVYKESYLSREDQISEPSPEKEESHLNLHIIPKWGKYRLNEISPKDIEDWMYSALGLVVDAACSAVHHGPVREESRPRERHA